MTATETLERIDATLSRISRRIAHYKQTGQERRREIELMVADRLLDERLTLTKAQDGKAKRVKSEQQAA